MGNIQPNWLPAAPLGPRDRQVAKRRELAKRVVAKQQVCEADKGCAAQSVASHPQAVQAVDCGRDRSSLGHAQLVARVLSVNCGSCELMPKQYRAYGLG